MKQQLTLWGVCILVVGHPSHLGGIVGALSHVVLGYLLMVVANCVTHRLPVVRPTPMMGHARLVWPTHPRVLCVPGPARGHGGSGHHQRRGWTGQWGQVCREATNSTTNTLPQVAVWTKRQAHKQKQNKKTYRTQKLAKGHWHKACTKAGDADYGGYVGQMKWVLWETSLQLVQTL